MQVVEIFFIAVIGLLVSATAAAHEQATPSTVAKTGEESRPVNRIAGDKVGEALLGAKGYDLTRLFPGGSGNPNDGELVMGSSWHAVKYEGVIFQFASKQGKEAFAINPERYLPGAGGYCLIGLYRRGIGDPTAKGPVSRPGDPAARTYANGRWYFQGSKGAEVKYEQDPDTINSRTQKAAGYFESLRKTESIALGPVQVK